MSVFNNFFSILIIFIKKCVLVSTIFTAERERERERDNFAPNNYFSLFSPSPHAHLLCVSVNFSFIICVFASENVKDVLGVD